jgi:hypothetical protein
VAVRANDSQHCRPAVDLPAHPTKPVIISPRFLSEKERITLADLRTTDRSIRSIAAEIGRSPSTISKNSAATRTRLDGMNRTACIGGPRTDDRVPGQATLLGTPRSRSTSRTA